MSDPKQMQTPQPKPVVRKVIEIRTLQGIQVGAQVLTSLVAGDAKKLDAEMELHPAGVIVHFTAPNVPGRKCVLVPYSNLSFAGLEEGYAS